MKVPFLDLRVADSAQRGQLLKRIDAIFRHGRLIEGPEQLEFEQRFAKTLGVKYAVGVGSGSSALFLALKSLDVGKGDEVITTPFTWIITTHAIAATGAKPVFVDVGRDYNIDPDQVEQAITSRTKCIVPVHIGGLLCDVKKLSKIAKKNFLSIVEDSAQAYCAALQNRRAGTFSKVAAFSFNPMKILHGYGESGAITTNNKHLRDRIRRLRHAGTRPDPKGIQINISDVVSLNHKMDTLQASLLDDSMTRIGSIWEARQRIAILYDFGLANGLRAPGPGPNEMHGRYLYMITVGNRKKLRTRLAECGVETKVFYSPLVCDSIAHRQKRRHSLPMARKLEQTCLALPFHEKMTVRQVNYVIKCVNHYASPAHF